jgi:two-component system response regulator FixJ
MPSKGTIHVIDDDAGVCRSIGRLLHRAGYHTMAYESGVVALAESQKMLNGCILIDLRMPGMDGLELQRQLKDRCITLPVVVMTGQGDIATAVRAMKAGAVDFIEKPFSDACLFDAIEVALSRHSMELEESRAARRLATLSPRERDVLEGLLQGRSNKIIAHDLGLSVRTVEVHRARMMDRLGTRLFAKAIRLAVLAMNK